MRLLALDQAARVAVGYEQTLRARIHHQSLVALRTRSHLRLSVTGLLDTRLSEATTALARARQDRSPTAPIADTACEVGQDDVRQETALRPGQAIRVLPSVK